MADQTSPIQPIEAATNAATRLNENFDAASPAMLYGRDARTTTGLTWGYVGGRFGSALIASGTVTLTASSTNHVVAARADGVVTSLVATTNWDDLTDYIRLYKVTAGASAVTGYEDHRQAIGGAGGGGAIVAADITDSTTVGRAVLTAVDEPAARTAIGAGTSNFSGAYADLTGKPTLGTAAALNVAASGDAAAGEVVRGDDTRLGTGGMTNPMTTAGDLIVGGASGAPTRLGISTNGYVLTLASGVPVWSASAGGAFTGGALTSALNEAKGADIARATTTDIGAATGNFVHLTGTTTVTGLGTVQAGTRRTVRFAGAGTLTHNATSLILPGAANITTAANDCAIFVSEGSGNWRCVAYTKANGQSVIVPAATVTGFTPSLATSSPNNTINASRLLASGGSTNQDVVLQPKGSGAVLAQLPDNTIAGGNKRGLYSIDFQLERAGATQVASGAYAVIAGGSNNTASGISSAALGGISNTVSGQNSFSAGGSSNTVSGEGSSSIGGISNYALGKHSVVLGGSMATTRETTGAVVQASGGFSSVVGSAQTRSIVAGALTSDATPTDLLILEDSSRVVISGDGLFVFDVIISAQSALSDFAGFRVSGLLKRHVAAVVTGIVGTPIVTPLGASSGASTWSVSAVADTTNGALAIRVTGESGKSIKWVGGIFMVEACS